MSMPSAETIRRRFLPCQAPGHDTTAPSRRDSEVSGTIRSSATSWVTPSPWHSGQAPDAVLGENASAARCAAPAG